MKNSNFGFHFILIVTFDFSIVNCENIVQKWNKNFSEAINQRFNELETKQENCERRIKMLETELKGSRVSVKKRSINGGNVAFSVLLNENQGHIGLSQTIKYDKVLLNDGNGYSVHSGTFIAPIDGVYMFSYFFGHGYDQGQVWLELMHNGLKVNAAVTDTYHEWQDLQGGNIAIIQVRAGDSIWIQSYHQNNAEIFGVEGFTSFSGVLLY